MLSEIWNSMLLLGIEVEDQNSWFERGGDVVRVAFSGCRDGLCAILDHPLKQDSNEAVSNVFSFPGE